MSGHLRLMLGVRSEIEAAKHCCVSDAHVTHHLDGALAQIAGVERDLQKLLENAYKDGFAACYAKQTIERLRGGSPAGKDET